MCGTFYHKTFVTFGHDDSAEALTRSLEILHSNDRHLQRRKQMIWLCKENMITEANITKSKIKALYDQRQKKICVQKHYLVTVIAPV